MKSDLCFDPGIVREEVVAVACVIAFIEELVGLDRFHGCAEADGVGLAEVAERGFVAHVRGLFVSLKGQVGIVEAALFIGKDHADVVDQRRDPGVFLRVFRVAEVGGLGIAFS